MSIELKTIKLFNKRLTITIDFRSSYKIVESRVASITLYDNDGYMIKESSFHIRDAMFEDWPVYRMLINPLHRLYGSSIYANTTDYMSDLTISARFYNLVCDCLDFTINDGICVENAYNIYHRMDSDALINTDQFKDLLTVAKVELASFTDNSRYIIKRWTEEGDDTGYYMALHSFLYGDVKSYVLYDSYGYCCGHLTFKTDSTEWEKWGQPFFYAYKDTDIVPTMAYSFLLRAHDDDMRGLPKKLLRIVRDITKVKQYKKSHGWYC